MSEGNIQREIGKFKAFIQKYGKIVYFCFTFCDGCLKGKRNDYGKTGTSGDKAEGIAGIFGFKFLKSCVYQVQNPITILYIQMIGAGIMDNAGDIDVMRCETEAGIA